MRSDSPEPLELSSSLAAQVDRLLAVDQRYDAIKLVRRTTGAGLVVATRAVDHRQPRGSASE